MPFGEFKFTALCRVPVDYLFKVYKSTTDLEFKKYMDDNWRRMVLRKNGRIKAQPLNFPCTKFIYPTEKAAKQALREISLNEQEHQKPIRVYQCNKCGAWHLTSKPLWQKISNPK